MRTSAKILLPLMFLTTLVIGPVGCTADPGDAPPPPSIDVPTGTKVVTIPEAWVTTPPWPFIYAGYNTDPNYFTYNPPTNGVSEWWTLNGFAGQGFKIDILALCGGTCLAMIPSLGALDTASDALLSEKQVASAGHGLAVFIFENPNYNQVWNGSAWVPGPGRMQVLTQTTSDSFFSYRPRSLLVSYQN